MLDDEPPARSRSVEEFRRAIASIKIIASRLLLNFTFIDR